MEDEYLNLVLLVIFVVSDTCVPLLTEVISLNGGCEKSTFLAALPATLGMCFPFLFTRDTSGTIRWEIIITIAIIEAASQALIMDGLIMAGSAIYTVAYSSVTMYTAIFAYLFLSHELHPSNGLVSLLS